jgi:glucose/arabinose dehydrogenase
VGLVAAGLASVAAILLVNFQGWRELILSRLLRVGNPPQVVEPPHGFLPRVPAGFKVSVFARGFEMPRWLATAPNGDIFVADSGAGSVVVLDSGFAPGTAPGRAIFADHLNLPFGIAFHENFVYVAETNQVVRFPFNPQTSMRLGDAQHLIDLPGLGYNQHWTRSLAFSSNGTNLFVSVGSQSNEAIESDPRRAAILVTDPDGKHQRIFASGLRNAVGIGFDHQTEQLWAAVNERDNLGDDVPDDYFTHVVEGGFYGWPYSYLGRHVDDRVASRPDLVAKAIAPDMLLGAHVAPLQFAFYGATQFPIAYRRGAFIAEHGSWNRRLRVGYQVVFVPFANGAPSGGPVPFLTGFSPDPREKAVYGRPVGVTVAPDGSLLVSDDGAKLIWRISAGH